METFGPINLAVLYIDYIMAQLQTGIILQIKFTVYMYYV